MSLLYCLGVLHSFQSRSMLDRTREAVAPPRSLYTLLAGRWRGTLEYRDYRDSTRVVTLPTSVDIVPAEESGGLDWRYSYDDSPGKTVLETSRFVLDSAAATLSWAPPADSTPQRYRVRSWDTAGGTSTLVADGEGMDNNHLVSIRETLVASARQLPVLKKTRTGSAPYAFRHRYRFAR